MCQVREVVTMDHTRVLVVDDDESIVKLLQA